MKSRYEFNEAREVAFQEFKADRGRDANGESFQRGWHARDEEVRRLRDALADFIEAFEGQYTISFWESPLGKKHLPLKDK